jgi:hypothetical protein
MKAYYNTPKIIQVSILTKHLVSASTTEQNVYTDDPQNINNALVKEKDSSRDIWNDEW